MQIHLPSTRKNKRTHSKDASNQMQTPIADRLRRILDKESKKERSHSLKPVAMLQSKPTQTDSHDSLPPDSRNLPQEIAQTRSLNSQLTKRVQAQ